MSRNLFSEEEKLSVEDAIANAERFTSGEIRVHIDSFCIGNPIRKAIRVFRRLKMYETSESNGVLIYIALKNHKLAIIGDKGINDKVPVGFWENEKNIIISYFKDARYADGLIEGIRLVGDQLKIYFPAQDSDENELSNEISFGN
jgi:uncharacterized membrane protein